MNNKPWKWYKVKVSKRLNGQTMQIDFSCIVTVRARDEGEAMRRTRAEFKQFYLEIWQ